MQIELTIGTRELTGIKCTRDDWPDTGATIQLDPRGLCQRAFITRRDV